MYTDMAIVKKHVKAVIQLRRAKEQEWIDLNPILRVGEPALSTDVYKLKIGNGHDHWADIPYLLENEYNEIMELIEHGIYDAGNGIIINEKVISLDDLILDCGTSTTNI
jgi:hypothetical protein